MHAYHDNHRECKWSSPDSTGCCTGDPGTGPRCSPSWTSAWATGWASRCHRDDGAGASRWTAAASAPRTAARSAATRSASAGSAWSGRGRCCGWSRPPSRSRRRSPGCCPDATAEPRTPHRVCQKKTKELVFYKYCAVNKYKNACFINVYRYKHNLVYSCHYQETVQFYLALWGLESDWWINIYIFLPEWKINSIQSENLQLGRKIESWKNVQIHLD